MADFSITGEVKLNSDPAEKSTSKWTVAAGNMIADFAKKAASSLAKVVQSGVDYNATMEKHLANFKVMLGDEEAAAEKLEQIRKMAASTPFTMPQLTDATQTLLQFGITADDATDVLQRLGDISLGNAEKLQTLTRAYGKMSSAQKVTLENVNMMIDAGFNPLNQICEATGETMSDLYKRISDGKVSFSELEAAVVSATSEGGQFFNGMAEASQTFSGRMATMQENVTALVGKLTDGLFASLGELIDIVNETAVSFLDSDEKMAALKETVALVTSAVAAGTAAFAAYKAQLAIQSILTAVTKAMNGMTVAQYAVTTAQKLLNAAIASNPIGLAVTVVAALTAALVTAYQTSETFRNKVSSAFEWAKQAAQKEIGAIVEWVDDLVARFNGAAAALSNLKNGVAAAKAAYNEAYNAALSERNSAKLEAERQRRKTLHEERVRQAQEEAATIKETAEIEVKAAEDAGEGIQEVTDEITTVTEGSVKKVTTSVTDGAEEVTKELERTENDVVKSVTSVSKAVINGVDTTVKTVIETLSDGSTRTKQIFTETENRVIDGALVTVETVRTIAADGTETIAQTIKERSDSTLDGLFDSLQTRADEGVLGTFDTLYNAVQGQDWAGVGKWAAATLYNGLSADRKQQIENFAFGIIDHSTVFWARHRPNWHRVRGRSARASTRASRPSLAVFLRRQKLWVLHSETSSAR